MLVNFHRGQFVVAAGSNQEVILNCVNRAKVRRVVLVQRTGTLGGFTANLYEAPLAVRAETSPMVYQVMPTIVAATAVDSSAVFAVSGGGYPYQSVNSDQLPGSGIRNSELYLQINVAGTGPMTFDWVIATEPML